MDSSDAGTDRPPPSTRNDASDASDASDARTDGEYDALGDPCVIVRAPSGTFSFLSAGNGGTCGIHDDGTVACWGLFWGPPPTPAGAYKDVSRHGGVCAVRSSGELDCWGLPTRVGATPAGQYEQVVIAEDALCARSTDQVTCWGYMGYAPTQYRIENLTGGAYFMCGLEADQHAAVCWEPRTGAETIIMEPGPFTAVDTGRFFACGLHTDGSVTCWAANWPQNASDARILGQTPPVGPFRELSTGEFHACALRAAGEIVCWGENSYGQATPPAGLLLAHVEAGSTHTCGIRFDGTVVCWGDRAPATCGI